MNSLHTSEGHVCALPLQEEDAYSLQSHTHLFAKLRNQRRQDSVQINALRRPLIEDPPDAVKRAGAPLGGDCVAETLHRLAFGRRVGVSPSREHDPRQPVRCNNGLSNFLHFIQSITVYHVFLSILFILSLRFA